MPGISLIIDGSHPKESFMAEPLGFCLQKTCELYLAHAFSKDLLPSGIHLSPNLPGLPDQVNLKRRFDLPYLLDDGGTIYESRSRKEIDIPEVVSCREEIHLKP